MELWGWGARSRRLGFAISNGPLCMRMCPRRFLPAGECLCAGGSLAPIQVCLYREGIGNLGCRAAGFTLQGA